MSATARWDAIVIGAHVDGLVAAHYLARAGRRVLVLDPRKAPEQRVDVGWVPPQVIRELSLASRGLQVEHPDPWVAAPLPGGGRLELWRDVAASAEAIRRVSPADAAKWPEFCTRMRRLAGVLEALYVQPAPDIETREVGELLHLAGLGLHVRRLGKQTVIDLLRILPMSIAELLDDWFENDALKGVLGAAGVWHLRQGPRAGGTAFNFLHHHVGSPAGVFRPPRSNISQVLAAMPGVDVRRSTEAAVVAADGRATGVRLGPSGEQLSAPVVVSSADPQATFEPLKAQLDAEFVRAVGNIKARSIVARGTLTLERPADFTTLCLAPSLDYLERGHDDAKYGRNSASPYVEAHAVNGRVDLHVQYAVSPDPALAERVAAVLGAQGGQVSLEEPVSHLYHGELTLDQILFMRPVPGWSRYRTPIEGLYLCGPGTHPGGGIAGAAGRNAARVILKEKTRG
jgi:phytoene dehydrogenase-like protein